MRKDPFLGLRESDPIDDTRVIKAVAEDDITRFSKGRHEAYVGRITRAEDETGCTSAELSKPVLCPFKKLAMASQEP